jgi:pimeloyl-ACP methyl ester carboxylesterase
MEPHSEVIGVDVPGGTLAVELIGSPADAVLAVHGISSQRKLWNWLRAADPGLSLIAPDLRGRGGSVDVQGSSSLARPAADLVAALDQLGLADDHAATIMTPAGARASAALIAEARS